MNASSDETLTLEAAAENRDPIDVAEEWVAEALSGPAWECRDNYPYEDGYKCWVERGTSRDGNWRRLIDTPLTSAEACVIELLLDRVVVAERERDEARKRLEELEAGERIRARESVKSKGGRNA